MKRYFTCFSLRSFYSMLIFNVFSIVLSAQPLVTKDLPQYLLSEFSSTKIKMQEGNDIVLNLNYNTVTEKMVFIKSGRLFDLVNPQTVDTLFLQQYIFVPYDTVFLDFIARGKINFFIQHKSDVTFRNKPSMSGTAQVSQSNYYAGNKAEIVYFNQKLPESFIVKPASLYWVRVNDKMVKFANERQLFKIFPEKADLLKLFIKESDLKIDRRADLISIANYCNKIMK
jgi:hypothetical protein